ncbi:hypothetical protein KEM48_013998 [Puccinia striiformis f. sp. tritici PST-130]|nr:hypothetical protein KEM48_013998 [Puccinia striiformis f. sp. tritici PST-130]
MHDSHSNPDSNISETTSATLVSNVVTNEKQQGDGSQSSNLRHQHKQLSQKPYKMITQARRHPTDTCQAHVSTMGPILMTVGVLFTSLFMIVSMRFRRMASAPSSELCLFDFQAGENNSWLRDWARLLSWVIGFFLLASHLMLQLEIGTEFTRILATAIYSSGVDWLPTPVQLDDFWLILVYWPNSNYAFGRSPLAWKFIGVASLLLNLSACIVLRSTSNYKGTSKLFYPLRRALFFPPLSPPHRFIEGQSSVIGTLFLRCPPSGRSIRYNHAFDHLSWPTQRNFLGQWFLSLEPTRWVERFASEGSSFLVLISYLTPCVLYLFCAKGVYNQDGRNVWNLKGFSKPLAVIAALFLTLLLAIYSGPVRYPLTINTFPVAPWAGLSATIISLVFWFAYGKSHFIGPIKSLSTWSVGFEIDLPKKLSRSVAPRAPTGTRSATTTRPGPQSVNHRSGAILTSQANDTLGIPQTYCTYGSDGSLWTESADQSNL